MSQVTEFLTDEALPPSRNRRSWLRRIVMVLALVALVAAGYYTVKLAAKLGDTGDYVGEGTGSVTVIVKKGDSIRVIGQTLVNAGVVKTADAFVDAAAINDKSAKIGPGRYALREQMSGSAAVALMVDPKARADSRLVLPEGLTVDQTVAAASKATGIPKEEFTKALQQPEAIGLPKWAEGRPEGFLFPATYDLATDETATKVLRMTTSRFDQAMDDLDFVASAKDIGYTPYEVLTVASIVQAEGTPEDFAQIARVIYNRLRKGMKLQLDTTVSYALGVRQVQLDADQLATDTPYNTYLYEGLPPTPINNPGEAAMQAALSPARGNWLYFIVVDPKTKETKFTADYDEFLKYKKQFQENVAKQKAAKASASAAASASSGG